MKVPFLDLSKQHAPLLHGFGEVLTAVVKSPQLIHGSEHSEFERAWATYCGVDNCVGVGNGYDAMRLMLNAYIVKGRDVIVASNTHISTWLAVVAAEGRLVVAEPDPDTFVLTPATIAPVLTETSIVLATNLYGNAVNVDGIRDLGVSAVFLDAAQAHGLRDLNRATASAFSFYPTKNLGALGDGGAICTNNYHIADRSKYERNYGAVVANVHDLRGCNSRLDELQAAFLLYKLATLTANNERRRITAKRYSEAFSDIDTLRLPRHVGDSVWHQFVVRHDQRDLFRKRLYDRNIGTMVHYPTPPHLQPAFFYANCKIGRFPVAEQLANTCVSLPIGPELTDEQVSYVIDCVRWCA